ncbi:hypothetical protein [Falsiroseomonas sp.]|uniref:hypothetical protein n=1 Tax=Falsiroseomonas sp. TaxID=2870721 RepID=UPI003F711C4D
MAALEAEPGAGDGGQRAGHAAAGQLPHQRIRHLQAQPGEPSRRRMPQQADLRQGLAQRHNRLGRALNLLRIDRLVHQGHQQRELGDRPGERGRQRPLGIAGLGLGVAEQMRRDGPQHRRLRRAGAAVQDLAQPPECRGLLVRRGLKEGLDPHPWLPARAARLSA